MERSQEPPGTDGPTAEDAARHLAWLAEALDRRPLQRSRVRDVFSAITAKRIHLPCCLRFRAWEALLCGGPPPPEEDAELRRVVAATTRDLLQNQRVVRVDAERTRAGDPAFRAEATVSRVERLLTAYCLLVGTSYKQGLNEVLAILLYVDLWGSYRCSDEEGAFGEAGEAASAAAAAAAGAVGGAGHGEPDAGSSHADEGSSRVDTVPPGSSPPSASPPPAPPALPHSLTPHTHPLNGVGDGRLVRLLSAFIGRFAPRIYAVADESFISLQCSFRLFSLLLQFHEPFLWKLLGQHGADPELFATGWFFALFARSHRPEWVVGLWDVLIACEDAPELFHCIAVAFLVSHKDAILRHIAAADGARGGLDEPSDLPMLLSKLAFRSRAHVEAVAAAGLDLLASTPATFRMFLRHAAYSGGESFASVAGGKTKAPAPIPIGPTLLARLEKRIAVKVGIGDVLEPGSPMLGGSWTLPGAATGGSSGASSSGSAEGEAASSAPQPATASTHAPALQAARRRREEADTRRGLARLACVCSSSSTSSSSTSDAPAAVPFPGRLRHCGWRRCAAPTDPSVRPYILIDVRSRDEYERGGHVPTAFHVDPRLLHDPEALQTVVDEGLGPLSGDERFAVLGPGDISQWYHLPVLPAQTGDAGSGGGMDASRGASFDLSYPSDEEVGEERAGPDEADNPTTRSPAAPPSSSTLPVNPETVAVLAGLDPLTDTEEGDYGGPEDATRAVLLYLLQRGFKHVAEVEGGFTALHQHQAACLDATLVGHEPDWCMVCSAGAARERYRSVTPIEEAPLPGGGGGTAGADGLLSPPPQPAVVKPNARIVKGASHAFPAHLLAGVGVSEDSAPPPAPAPAAAPPAASPSRLGGGSSLFSLFKGSSSSSSAVSKRVESLTAWLASAIDEETQDDAPAPATAAAPASGASARLSVPRSGSIAAALASGAVVPAAASSSGSMEAPGGAGAAAVPGPLVAASSGRVRAGSVLDSLVGAPPLPSPPVAAAATQQPPAPARSPSPSPPAAAAPPQEPADDEQEEVEVPLFSPRADENAANPRRSLRVSSSASAASLSLSLPGDTGGASSGVSPSSASTGATAVAPSPSASSASGSQGVGGMIWRWAKSALTAPSPHGGSGGAGNGGSGAAQ